MLISIDLSRAKAVTVQDLTKPCHPECSEGSKMFKILRPLASE